MILRLIFIKLTKKRQEDYILFANIITYSLYMNHILACMWLTLGYMEDCRQVKGDLNSPLRDDCKLSWSFVPRDDDGIDYENTFSQKKELS